MPFPFTFTLATPGHSNPFLNPPSPPRRKSITRTSPIAKPLFNKPPTSPTAYPRSPLPSIQRRPGTIYAPSSQLTNPIPPPLSLSKKRGWEPAFTSPPKSKKMEIGITRSYFDPPVQYQEMVEDILGAAPDELPPPAKRRRGLAGSIVSTAISAALIGTAIGLTVYRLWRDRGKDAERLPPPPPYQEAEWVPETHQQLHSPPSDHSIAKPLLPSPTIYSTGSVSLPVSPRKNNTSAQSIPPLLLLTSSRHPKSSSAASISSISSARSRNKRSQGPSAYTSSGGSVRRIAKPKNATPNRRRVQEERGTPSHHPRSSSASSYGYSHSHNSSTSTNHTYASGMSISRPRTPELGTSTEAIDFPSGYFPPAQPEFDFAPSSSGSGIASSSAAGALAVVPPVEDEPVEDQMDWIGGKLSALIEEGKRALGREIVVMSDSKEDEVDDGSGNWIEEDEAQEEQEIFDDSASFFDDDEDMGNMTSLSISYAGPSTSGRRRTGSIASVLARPRSRACSIRSSASRRQSMVASGPPVIVNSRMAMSSPPPAYSHHTFGQHQAQSNNNAAAEISPYGYPNHSQSASYLNNNSNGDTRMLINDVSMPAVAVRSSGEEEESLESQELREMMERAREAVRQKKLAARMAAGGRM